MNIKHALAVNRLRIKRIFGANSAMTPEHIYGKTLWEMLKAGDLAKFYAPTGWMKALADDFVVEESVHAKT